MPWWQIALLIYLIPFPFPQIVTWILILELLRKKES